MSLIFETEQSNPTAAEQSRPDRPVVEVIMDGSLRRESIAVPGRDPSSRGMGEALARRAAPAPAAALEAPAEAVADVEPVGEPESVEDGSAEPSAEPDADAEPAETPDLEAKPADPPPISPVPSVELEAARQEAHLLRARQSGVTHEREQSEREEYIANPSAAIRKWAARMAGVDPNAKDLDKEIDFLQRELTFALIGEQTLPDDQKWKRHEEHQGRAERLKQQAPTTTSEAQAAHGTAVVSSVLKGIETEFPFLALATELDGVDPARAALEIWTEAVRAGRIVPSATDTESAREALRLANVHYQTRAERIFKFRPTATAPTSTPAPAQASAHVAAPGAPKQQPSTAPVKAGSAPPTTLSAKQAAAAPRAKAEPQDRNAALVIDPSDKDAERDRRLAIVRKRRPA